MIKKQNGFTLVEMIIVTVIIGILAGIVISVINIPRVQARSRDAKRIGDIKRIQTALELYFSDNRSYPPQTSAWIPAGSIPGITPSYIKDVPKDSRAGDVSSTTTCFSSTADTYGYYYRSETGGTYVIGTVMELETSAENSVCGVDISNCTTISEYGCGDVDDVKCYCVQNPL